MRPFLFEESFAVDPNPPVEMPVRKETDYSGTGDNTSPWVSSPFRRCIDFSVAAVALFCFLPLLLLTAIAVCFSSAGPILFRQRRMGRGGQEFTLYKFRSMYAENANGPAITVNGDPRITRVGTFLRAYKLDELPQLWNVLRGDMSLVGPRPKLPQHEALRLFCRPGITGAATLVFRNEEDLLCGIPREDLGRVYEMFIKPAKAHLDREYMQNATLSSDLRILWLTASACFSSSQVAALQQAEFPTQWPTHPSAATVDCNLT